MPACWLVHVVPLAWLPTRALMMFATIGKTETERWTLGSPSQCLKHAAPAHLKMRFGHWLSVFGIPNTPKLWHCCSVLVDILRLKTEDGAWGIPRNVCALCAHCVQTRQNPTRTEPHPKPPTTSKPQGKQQEDQVKYSATFAQQKPCTSLYSCWLCWSTWDQMVHKTKIHQLTIWACNLCSVSQNRGSRDYDCKVAIFKTTNCKKERKGCTHHQVIPHDHSPTSMYKRSTRGEEAEGRTSCGPNSSTLTKHPFYTLFHTNSDEIHVINSMKLILHPKNPRNLRETGLVVADIQNVAQPASTAFSHVDAITRPLYRCCTKGMLD